MSNIESIKDAIKVMNENELHDLIACADKDIQCIDCETNDGLKGYALCLEIKNAALERLLDLKTKF